MAPKEHSTALVPALGGKLTKVSRSAPESTDVAVPSENDEGMALVTAHFDPDDADLVQTAVCPTCGRPFPRSPMSPGARTTSSFDFRRLLASYRAQLLANSETNSTLESGTPTTGDAEEIELGDDSPDRPTPPKRERPKKKDSSPTKAVKNNSTLSEADGLNRSRLFNDGQASVAAAITAEGYYKQFFREEKKLGHGGFGAVYVCRHIVHCVDLGRYAVKKIPLGDLTAANSDWVHKVLKEVVFLETLQRHPNIIEYNHSWIDVAQLSEFSPTTPCLFILMQYADQGSLSDVLEDGNRVLTDDELLFLFISVLRGLSYLHSLGILHRDLKPDNVLLASPRRVSAKASSRFPQVLLSDFGTCEGVVNEAARSDRGGFTGTRAFMAPELSITDEDGHYMYKNTRMSDMWSLGVLLYRCAYGRLPCFVENADEIFDYNAFKDFRPSTPKHRRPVVVEALITSLLSLEPEKRPTAEELLEKLQPQWMALLTRSEGTSPRLVPLLQPPPTSPVSSGASAEGVTQEVQLPPVHDYYDKSRDDQRGGGIGDGPTRRRLTKVPSAGGLGGDRPADGSTAPQPQTRDVLAVVQLPAVLFLVYGLGLGLPTACAVVACAACLIVSSFVGPAQRQVFVGLQAAAFVCAVAAAWQLFQQ